MTRLLDLYDALSPLLIVGGFLLGRWTASSNAVGKRQAHGTVSRDFSAPGMPYAGIVDAEVLGPENIVRRAQV